MQGYLTYEVVFLGAMLVAILTTPIVIRIARAMRIVDVPDARKVHASAIPRLGGASIVFAMLAMTLPVLALDNVIGQAFRQDQTQIIVLLAGSLFMFAVGLIDDIKNLRGRIKLVAQSLAALAVCSVGVRIEAFAIEGVGAVSLGWLSWPVTLLWIVGITNALNFIDGLDGLAAGISVIACGVLAAFAFSVGQPVMAILMLAALGSLLGFLFLNFNPARIFMGDCGSLFLGFLIASASVRASAKSASLVGLALPFLVLGIPILDTMLSFLRRMERRSLFSPDRQHIHHRLLDAGLTQRQVAILVYLVTLILAGLGLFLLFVRGPFAMLVLGLALLLLMIFFHASGALRLREVLQGLGRNRWIAREIRRQNEDSARAELAFRQVRTIESWWTAVCQAAERIGVLRLDMPLQNRDGSVRLLNWCQPGTGGSGGEVIRVDVPVRQRRAGESPRMTIQVQMAGSVELAGCRATCFSRILERQSIASLPIASSSANSGPRDETLPGTGRPSSLPNGNVGS